MSEKEITKEAITGIIEENNWTDEETWLACAKMLAVLMSERASKMGGTSINYKIGEVTLKDSDKSYGSIEINWNKM